MFLRKESEGGGKVEGKKEFPWFGTKEHDKGKKLIHGPHKNILSAQICEESGSGQKIAQKDNTTLILSCIIPCYFF